MASLNDSVAVCIGHSKCTYTDFFLSGKDVAIISQKLKSVINLDELALWLDIKVNIIASGCLLGGTQATCFRLSIVQHCCNKESSGNPSKVAEHIAEALEQMDYNSQAKALRELRFGKWCVNATVY